MAGTIAANYTLNGCFLYNKDGTETFAIIESVDSISRDGPDITILALIIRTF